MGDEAKMTHALWAAAETARWEKQMPDTPTSITQFWMDRIIADKQAEAVTAALDALAAKVPTMWLGVELLGVNDTRFDEPMVSASDARAAVLTAIKAYREDTE